MSFVSSSKVAMSVSYASGCQLVAASQPGPPESGLNV
jgi:hypothetical protein